MRVLETQRLVLEHLTTDDADFMLELVNEPAFLRYIGDRGVRTVDEARTYIQKKAIASYEEHGYGTLRVRLQGGRDALGLCGLMHRDFLDEPDLGFAFLARHRRHGYASEASVAVLDWARFGLGLQRVVAMVSPENEASIHLIEGLGMRLDRMVQAVEGEPEIRLYGLDLHAPT